jgi:hypothetical protein
MRVKLQKVAVLTCFFLLLTLFFSQTKASFFVEQGFQFAFHSNADLIMGKDFTFSTDAITYGNGSVNIGGVWLTSTCDMNLTAYFENDWLNYTVTTLGAQQIYNGSKPKSILIDAVNCSEGQGWTYFAGTTTVISASSVAVNWVAEGPNKWYFNFQHKDVDAYDVSGRVTWKLYNGSQLLSYTQGAPTLFDGTYTLKTYYHNLLVLASPLSTVAYGNTTVTVTLYAMQKHLTLSGGGWIVHDGTPETGYVISNQTGLNLTFAPGAYGFTYFIIDVPSNATFITVDGVNLTSWVYEHDAVGYFITFQTGSLTICMLNFANNPPELLADPYFIAAVGLTTAAGATLTFYFYRRNVKARKKVVPL